MADMQSYLNKLMGQGPMGGQTHVMRPPGSWQNPTRTKGKPKATTTTAPTTNAPAPGPAAYSATNPPPGFTASQWSQLLNLSKTNSGLADLIKQFTGSVSTPQPSQAWRRELPTSTNQLLRQLSYNAGELGMPGGYVGAVQMPSYGSGLAPVNNPDMSTYGRTPNLGEAAFYQQSMKGGMTPIAAMSPMGVPAGWNPGGSSTDDMKSQLGKYLQNMQGQNAGGGGGWMADMGGGMTGSGFGVDGAGNMFMSMFGHRFPIGNVNKSSTPAPTSPTTSPQPFPISGGAPITPPYGTL